MLVVRRSFLTRTWQERPLADVAKQWLDVVREQISPDLTYRIYVFHTGPANTVEIELEVESLQEWEELWESMLHNADVGELMPQTTELSEPGGACEIWFLHAQA